MVYRSRKKGGKLPPFVPLTWKMLNSSAYKKLKQSSAKALPYFLGKVKLPLFDPQRYSSPFSFSYTEAKKYGFANGTFSRVIIDLMDKGFIDPKDKGGLRGDCKTSNKFMLSQRWEEYGTKNFNEVKWQCFAPKNI